MKDFDHQQYEDQRPIYGKYRNWPHCFEILEHQRSPTKPQLRTGAASERNSKSADDGVFRICCFLPRVFLVYLFCRCHSRCFAMFTSSRVVVVVFVVCSNEASPKALMVRKLSQAVFYHPTATTSIHFTVQNQMASWLSKGYCSTLYIQVEAMQPIHLDTGTAQSNLQSLMSQVLARASKMQLECRNVHTFSKNTTNEDICSTTNWYDHLAVEMGSPMATSRRNSMVAHEGWKYE